MNVGILASGGDGAGMNYCLFNLYKKLKTFSNIVLFNQGYKGLIYDEVLNFDYNYIKKHKNDGGIIIKTSRCEDFETEKGQEKALLTIKKYNLDCLIVMGGNGSLQGALKLAELNQNVMFIPCTIDNDVKNSEYCIGYDTACFNCTNFVKHVNDTMKSFNRVCIYQAMGRKCPKIAMTVAKNVNADYAYVDKDCSVSDCVDAIKNCDTDAPIVILRENLIDIELLRDKLKENLNKDVKTCIVGYVQRGGKPTKVEKNYAKMFADKCANEIKNNHFNNAIVIENNLAVSTNINNLR